MERSTPTRLMLVDDEPDVLSTLGEILQEYGYAVVSASAGEDAVDIASLFDPSVVVTDFSLPGIDGVTMVHRLRQRSPNMRAILVSGNISNSTRKRADQEHMDGIFEKPLSVPDLLRRIRQVDRPEKLTA